MGGNDEGGLGDIALLAGLGIGLLVLSVIFGFAFIFLGLFESVTCEKIDKKFYDGGNCFTDNSKNVSSESASFNSTGEFRDILSIVISFLIILVLAILIRIIIKIINLKKMMSGL